MKPAALSLALSGVIRSRWLAGLEPRGVLRACARSLLPAGGRWITLDVTAPGFRPRDLDGSARRDLSAALRRDELLLAGLDCFVPSDHFRRSETRERAVTAVVQALGLTEDLDARRLAIRAGEGLPDDVAAALASEAARRGIVLTAFGEHGTLTPAAIADAADPAILASNLSGVSVVRWPWPIPVSGAEASALAPMLATLGIETCDLDLSAAGDPVDQLPQALAAWADAAEPFVG